MKLAFLLLPATLLAQAVPDAPYFEPNKIRALIVTGRNNHDWRTTTPFLRRILEVTARFDVRVTEEPMSMSAESLKPYDVLIVNYCGPRWSPPTEAAIENFVRQGKGLVAIHAASYPFGDVEVLAEKMGRTGVIQQPWPEWARMVGARWAAADPKTGHGTRHAYQVTWKDGKHPIAAGLAPHFLISDELYHNFRLEPGIHVLATAFDALPQRGTGKDEPLLWTVDYGKGRVFHTALGHDLAAMQSPGFVASYARGVEWAARNAVTLPASIDLNPKDKDAVRVLLVTGGHSHEASLYAMFEGNRRIRVDVDPHPAAFRRDIRKAYDVVVFYDLMATMPDEHKANLKAFVECGGKGIVVLHHAMADFADWDWWWKEVAGGGYDLKKSGFQHDVELIVRPTGNHPIVKGLPEMRLYDETYIRVWQGDNIQPLLTIDHPTSDRVAGWIGPSKTAKVVVLQPGHGREAHENPWYRTLVERAILWSAGR
ncbi:MAG: ThuA domain-containing protein [Acidobacteria bacterium]|nr:ThuA domain-containing protein [Acidobacteriota bacterium]